MRIQITPKKITLPDGTEVTVKQAEVSIAMANSAAIRIVPVTDAGEEVPTAMWPVLIPNNQAMWTQQDQQFMQQVSVAVRQLINGRGK
jgi:hypothetical protein